jgi:hypothetical protein
MNADALSVRLFLRLLIGLLFFVRDASLAGQSYSPKDSKSTPSVACSIRTENKEWSPTKPPILYIYVESLSEERLDIPFWSLLSLAPVSHGDSLSTQLKDAGKLAAGVDPTAVEAVGPSSNVITRNIRGDRSIRLRFDHKGEKAVFKVDGRDLTWDYEVVNRPPTFKLFAIAKSGIYDAQFHMWWENGSCESSKITITVQPAKTQQ